MLNKLLLPGQRIEMKIVRKSDENGREITFLSQIYDIDTDNEKINISMPIKEGRLIPLPVGSRYSVCFYTEKGLYQCECVITDRYKSNNLYVLVIEPRTELQKYQRRQFFRLETVTKISYRVLKDPEIAEIEKAKKIADNFDAGELLTGTSIDISGGGLKFSGKEQLEKGCMIYTEFSLAVSQSMKKFRIVAEVIESARLANRYDMFQNRIKYLFITPDERELLIKYIFEEERRIRKSERMI